MAEGVSTNIQNVERAVKMVTASSSLSSDADKRNGFMHSKKNLLIGGYSAHLFFPSEYLTTQMKFYNKNRIFILASTVLTCGFFFDFRFLFYVSNCICTFNTFL